MRHKRIRTLLLAGCAAMVLVPAVAFAQAGGHVLFDIPAQPLGAALTQFAQQSQREILFSSEVTRSYRAPAVRGDMAPTEALGALLAESGLTYRATPTGSLVVEVAQGPQGGSAGAAGGDVDALIVTAQKREENIQDVPIAISAFSQKALEEQKIEGGFDLLKAIPNVTFSKNNFTSYNFSIRGIGTKAVSATTDPAVAVSFNNMTLIQNRLFEQEYFDVERVEVLRGPQGTLYGRNATAGVINVISAKPDMNEFKGSIKGEVGNYQTKRLAAMVNVPLVEDKLAVRFAGALTDRQGYDFNNGTGHAVNGRDLWSGRLTIGFNPTDRLRADIVWERFNEDDNRSRTGKQLCHRDPSKQEVGGLVPGSNWLGLGTRPAVDAKVRILAAAYFSQGCSAGSLYDDAAFGTPNGLSLPFIWAAAALGTGLFPLGFDRPPYPDAVVGGPLGPADEMANPVGLVEVADPYGGLMQSSDLRQITSFRDPIYRAEADLLQVNLEFDLTDTLSGFSQTVYDKDTVYSFQDYNRFNTVPIFPDTSLLFGGPLDVRAFGPLARSRVANLSPGGIFCDPQLGCSSSIAGFDISQSSSEQFSQELRLQSSFEGAINFSAGIHYTKFKAVADYYVMYNVITAFALVQPFNNPALGEQVDITKCFGAPFSLDGTDECPYIDPNPVESINGDGHNYFRSQNPYKLDSRAVFGEMYWDVSEELRITAGLRYTDDQKTFTPIPTQILMSTNVLSSFGHISRGHPADPDIKQDWQEFSGRLGVDWKPDLPFTDQSMVYAFYSRGYKGGGANPPGIGIAPFIVPFLPPLSYGPTFDPEFVHAYEAGSKNTLLGGALTLNANTFYYDYTDYQVSKIVDRTAVNENFDAKVWGFELQTLFAPSRDFNLIANLGYLDTRINDGESSIDIMDRTAGNSDWVVVKPYVLFPSNCIAPVAVAAIAGEKYSLSQLCHPVVFATNITDPATGELWTPDAYPESNGGTGFAKQLGGNELPNAPHWTVNLGAQYGVDVLEGWRATLRGDAYWQSQSWARPYNAVNDKLHGWYNVNLSVWVENDDGLKIEFYAKNLLDKTPITDAFLNSDDTGLTTNVFVLDPRLIGLSIRQTF